ncbi:MAG: MFS transporter [Defluviitaleaceae bacterium]|nr:MFS transporter [Defluviitaleaceae bacterium]
MELTKKLWNKDFILFMTGLELSSIGRGLLRFIIPLYVLNATGSPVLIGTILAISAIPFIILLPIGGVSADRFSKKKLLALMNFSTAIIIIAYMGLSNVLALVPATIIFMLLLSTLESMITPSTDASIPSLVAADDLIKANSINWLFSMFSEVGAPILGGFILARLGLAPALFVSVAFCIMATVIKLMVKIPYAKQDISQRLLNSIVGDIRDGIRFAVKENTIVGKIFLMSLVIGFFLLPINYVVISVLVSTYLEMREGIVGLVQGIVMLGASAGAVLPNLLGKKANITNARFLLLISCIALIFAGVGTMWSTNSILTLLIITASFFLIMLSIATLAVISSSYIGEKTPEHLLGKVVSLDYMVAWLGIIISNYVLGFLLNHFIATPGVVLLIYGGIATVCALFLKISENF